MRVENRQDDGSTGRREPRWRSLLAAALLSLLTSSCAMGRVHSVTLGLTHVSYVTRGTVGPVVVFESGMDDGFLPWNPVFDAVAARTTSVAYSRPGYASGSFRREPDGKRTADVARTLRTMLARKAVPPPYVLVGHSIGRSYVLRFAKLHPEDVAGIAEDVTERRKQEEEHRRFEAGVRHAQKLESLGVLAGGIAHDFNNLLMGILGNADETLVKLAPESPGRESLERIKVASQRVAELTNQMLAYSGRATFRTELIDFNRPVEEMSHLLRAVISKKARLQLDLGADLPLVQADPAQVRQVAMNLITNDSDAIGDEEGVIRVTTGLVEASRALLARCDVGERRRPGPYLSLFRAFVDPSIPAPVWVRVVRGGNVHACGGSAVGAPCRCTAEAVGERAILAPGSPSRPQAASQDDGPRRRATMAMRVERLIRRTAVLVLRRRGGLAPPGAASPRPDRPPPARLLRPRQAGHGIQGGTVIGRGSARGTSGSLREC